MYVLSKLNLSTNLSFLLGSYCHKYGDVLSPVLHPVYVDVLLKPL